MKLTPIIYLVALLTLTAVSADGAELRLKFSDLDRMVVEGNSSVPAAEISRQAHEKRTGYLWKSFTPRFDLTLGQEIFKTGNYERRTEPYGNLSTSINLFNGFRDLNRSRLRDAQATLAKVENFAKVQETISSARQLYLQLAYSKELETTYASILILNDRVRKSAQLRQNRGMVTRTDLYEFDLYGSRLKEEIESLAHERELLSIRLSALLGLEETAIDPVDLLGHEHDDALVKRDFKHAPTAGLLKIQAEDSVRAAEAGFSRSWWLPSVDAYAGYYVFTLRDRDFLSIRDRDDFVAGVRATWSLFDFEHFSQSQGAALEAKASGLERKQRSRDFGAEVKATQGDLTHLHDLIHSSEERLKLGERYLQSTQSDYERGVKNSPDVISAIDKLIAIRRELLDRKLAYHRTRDRLSTVVREF